MNKLIQSLVGGVMVVMISLFIGVGFFSSCANIIPPGGGLRDTLPPRLIMAVPKDSALNVKPKLITLSFDEYVTAMDIPQNLVVNPYLENAPLVDYKLRNITIKLKDTLRDNTTYSFRFGEAIRDVNEGNIARNLTYTFSTGKTLDSLRYRGKVMLAQNGKIDSTLIVVLHRNLSDTAIFKLKPPYYAKLDGKGEFSFSFLPSDSFQVFVVKSTFTKKYDDSTDLFAFLPQPIYTGNTKKDTLYAYQAKEPVIKTSGTLPVKSSTSTTKEDKRIRFTTNLENGKQDLLQPLQLRFAKKIARLDTNGIQVCDTLFKPIQGVNIRLDTSGKTVVVSYPTKQNQSFRIILNKESVTDSAGATFVKSDTVKITTKKEEEYGSVRLRFSNLDFQRKPVLQIFQNDKFVGSYPLTSLEWRQPLYYPGNFEMRILYDTNGNGIWDPGQYPGNRKLPEVVYLIPKELSIRANWDNELMIQL
ncbi:MAG: hypothetical protein EBX50_04920 [Chitinophagia bacterium]|nr:hypothetical protein [Chitinophagia bacterium]